MGSAAMAFLQILGLAVLCLLTSADRHRRQDSASVPILKFIDQHNIDGSYTYGFEAGDGSYKIETRLASGEVKGKYGYIDPDGVLRETEYGATEERGFVSSLDNNDIGQRAPVPVQRNPAPSIGRTALRRQEPGQHFQEQARRLDNRRRNDGRIPSAGFQIQEQSRTLVDDRNNFVDGKIRIVNGRRAVIRKRARKLKQNQQPNQPQEQIQLQPTQHIETRQQQLTERENALAALQKARQELRELQQNQINSFGNGQQVKNIHSFGGSQQFSGFNNFGNQQRTSFNQQNQFVQRQTPIQQPGFVQQEAPRSQLGGRSFAQVQQPVLQQQQQHNVWAGHPAQNINLQDGSYSISYGR